MDVKKMLAVGTAIVGTVAMADIVSSSVVGYLGNDTRSSGATMMAGTFAAVSATDGSYTLGDLTVSGYDAPIYDEDEGETQEGTGVILGQFNLQFLSSSGTTEASYNYIDDGEHTKGWYDASWNSANNVVIPAGQAMWIVGRGLTLVSAGAVETSDIVRPTRSSGATAIGNGTPVDLTLGRLLVEGYEAPIYDEDEGETQEGTGVILGQFNVQFLSASGTTEASYNFIDDGEHTKGWYDASWNSGNAVSVPAGQGLWIVGRGLSLRVPAPEL